MPCAPTHALETCSVDSICPPESLGEQLLYPLVWLNGAALPAHQYSVKTLCTVGHSERGAQVRRQGFREPFNQIREVFALKEKAIKGTFFRVMNPSIVYAT